MSDTPAAQVRTLVGQLVNQRKAPCLLYISRRVVHADVLLVRQALGDRSLEHLDLILAGPGGDPEAAYLVAREIRRRVAQLTVYVPFRAKSATTMVALAADEVVFGALGELGPLDAQYDEKMAADFPLSTSRLVLNAALKELEAHAVKCYDTATRRILAESGMRPYEACSKAAEFVSALYGPLLARLDPVRLAESSRGLAIGQEYGNRLLRRYRPVLSDGQREHLLGRLIRGYPTHGFVVDQEEAQEIGLPVRPAESWEISLLDQLALTLIEFGLEQDLIELCSADPAVSPKREKQPRRREDDARARDRLFMSLFPERSSEGGGTSALEPPKKDVATV